MSDGSVTYLMVEHLGFFGPLESLIIDRFDPDGARTHPRHASFTTRRGLVHYRLTALDVRDAAAFECS